MFSRPLHVGVRIRACRSVCTLTYSALFTTTDCIMRTWFLFLIFKLIFISSVCNFTLPSVVASHGFNSGVTKHSAVFLEGFCSFHAAPPPRPHLSGEAVPRHVAGSLRTSLAFPPVISCQFLFCRLSWEDHVFKSHSGITRPPAQLSPSPSLCDFKRVMDTCLSLCFLTCKVR